MADKQTAAAHALCDHWGREAEKKSAEHGTLVVAESMVSTGVAGWISVEGEREVARHLYLLALQLTKIADQKEAASQQASTSIKH
jgi:hypothetical protein